MEDKIIIYNNSEFVKKIFQTIFVNEIGCHNYVLTFFPVNFLNLCYKSCNHSQYYCDSTKNLFIVQDQNQNFSINSHKPMHVTLSLCILINAALGHQVASDMAAWYLLQS